MAVAITNINYTDTFAGWLEKTNQVIYIISNNALTAAANVGGGQTTGNVNLTGIFQANTIAAATELRGGTVVTPATLTISTNTSFGGTVATFNSNVAVVGANLHINSTRTGIAGANLVVSANASFLGTATFSSAFNASGDATFSANATFNGAAATFNANTTFNNNTTVIQGGQLTVSSNVNLGGANTAVTGTNLQVAANATFVGTTIFSGQINTSSTFVSNIIPSASGKALGNTTNRWMLYATDLDITGTTALSNATLSGTYANVNAIAYLRANTFASGAVFQSTANTDLNAANVAIRGGTFNLSSNGIFTGNNTIGGSTLTVTANTTFQQKVVVQGDLQVTGNLSFTATSYADIVPSVGGYALGNTTHRWIGYYLQTDISGNLTVTGTTQLNGTVNANTGSFNVTGANVVFNTAQSGTPTSNATLVFARGSSANAYIRWDEGVDRFVMYNGTGSAANVVIADNGTYTISIAGDANNAQTALTANNSNYFGGQLPAFYANASNITTGTLAAARLSGSYAIDITGTANNSTNLNGQAASYYLNWDNITNKPTTAAGYGITDTVLLTTDQTVAGVKTFSSNTVFNANLSFGSSARQMLNLFGTTYGIGVQDLATYARTQKSFNIFRAGVHSQTENDPGTGGELILSVSNTSFTYLTNNVWHSGNLSNPVRTISGNAPAANGNVDLSTVYQPKSANLDTFAARVIGTASATDILDRQNADTRYLQLGGGTMNGSVYFYSYNERCVVTAISGGLLTIDLSAGNVFEVDLNQNITSISITGWAPSGRYHGFMIKFNVLGSYTIAWPTSIKHSSGSAPTISSTSGDIVTFNFYSTDGGTTVPAFYAGANR